LLSKCNAIHKTIVEQFRQAIVYGKSVKHQPQRVGLSHELADEDISESVAFQIDLSLTISVTIIKR
jgi:ribosome-interacting GTPase 1